MNAGKENMYIDQNMVKNVGNGVFMLLAIGKRLLIIDLAKKTVVKDDL